MCTNNIFIHLSFHRTYFTKQYDYVAQKARRDILKNAII